MSKIVTRLCSMILSAVMLLQMVPAQPVAAFMEAAMDTTVAEATATAEIEEVTTKRTEYTKEFKMSDGLHMAVVYPDAVHYEQDGRWEEIDNTLQLKGRGANAVYTNTAGVWTVQLPQSLSADDTVAVTKDGYTLSFAMTGQLRSSGDVVVASIQADTHAITQVQVASAQVETIDLSEAKAQAEYPQILSEKLQSRLRYDSVYADTDVVYDLTSNTLKESIVMDSYDATLRGYRYSLDVGSLRPVLQESGEILLCDERQEKIVMTMPAPYLVDDAGEYCADVTVALTGSGSSYTLSYYLPQQWLAEEDRAWPVVLDPIVSANTSALNIQDKTISSGGRDFGVAGGVLHVGYDTDSGYGICRAYLKYDNLPTLTSADVIVDAYIQLQKPNSSPNSAAVEVHQVTGAWTSSGLTWTNQPSIDNTVVDYAIAQAAGVYKWNITDIVREWYEESNNGLMFKLSNAIENAGVSNWKQFYSSDYGVDSTKPVLAITYRNSSGLESYWDYTTMSAGRAGTGYVSNYTGNLVWVHEGLGFGGTRMPVSISHIYNANDASSNAFGLGYGWRTNYNQKVIPWGRDSSGNWVDYAWVDGDGTTHHFYYDSSDKIYKDEDGLELTLTVSSDNKIITDKYGNTSHFNADGYLYKQENNQATKSSINISLAGSRIQSITDGAGRKYSFDYSTEGLAKIVYKGSGSNEVTYITFGYEDNGDLSYIMDKDGRYSAFYYNTSHLLTSVKDVDKYLINFSYNTVDSNKPNRVSQVLETHNSATGSELNFEYANNQTTITDHNGNKEILQFNNWGNTVSVQDGLGRAQYAKYAADEDDEGGKGNQLRLSSKLQNTVANLLTDSSFENGTKWTNIYSSGNANSVTTEAAYIGSKSLKLVQSANGTLCGAASVSTSVPGGASYTFSAYVKTTAGTTAKLAIKDNGTGENNVTVYSDTLAANSDWTRLEVTYTNPASSYRSISCRLLSDTAGTVYMDCVQLEKTVTASRYNLIENGDFNTAGSPFANWTGSGLTSVDKQSTNAAASTALSSYVFKVTGDPYAQKRIYQTVKVSGKKGDTFVLTGWAKGDSAPLETYDDRAREFSLIAVFNTAGGASEPQKVSFNPDTDSAVSWQYASAPVIAPADYASVTVYVAYDYNVNTVMFDGIQLYKEEFGSSYTYDEDGNVTSIVDLQKKQTKYEYTNNNLTKETLPSGAVLTYTYDNYHNVKTATTAEGQVYSFTYDTYGNNTAVSITSAGTTITSTAQYSSDGNRLVSTTDALGNVTTYGYNADTNVLEWVQSPEDSEDTRVNYTYNSLYRITEASQQINTDAENPYTEYVQYLYNGDYLSTVFTSGGTAYSFNYGNFGLRSNVMIGTRTLASYTYTDQDHYLSRLDYGNGCSVEYTYDNYGRLIQKTNMDNHAYTYKYNNESNLASVTDTLTGINTTYYYDFLGRALRYTETRGDNRHSVSYGYDEDNNLSSVTEVLNGTTRSTSYSYDDDNRVTSVISDNITRSYTYDLFGRLTAQSTGSAMTESYTYNSPSASATSAQVASKRTVSAGGYDITYSYTYDDNGNILSVSDGTHTTTYVYDTSNKLIRENNQEAGKTWTFEYGEGGNMVVRREYAYTTGELGAAQLKVYFGYSGEDAWGDLLNVVTTNTETTTKQATIENDEIGNMLSDGQWNYQWQNGRQLESMSNDEVYWDYIYNADGMRIRRSGPLGCYYYTYQGTQLSRMTFGSRTLDFTYGADGKPMAVSFNGTVYYYATNLQGDVVAILDANGNEVVSYTYDAWGVLLSTEGTLASTLGFYNPLRYRGYVYDEETGLYYLQSRYYRPEWGRFINADAYASTGQGILGNNMFAYCNNNPIVRTDYGGDLWEAVVGAAIGGAIAGALISTASYLVNSGKDSTLSGALSALGIGALSGAIGGAAGALGSFYPVIGSVVVGLINGTITACNTDGSPGDKLVAGAATALVTGGGTYLGTKVYTPTDSAFSAAVSAYASGLAVGAPTEMINVVANKIVNAMTDHQNISTGYDVRRHLRAERALG